MRDATRAGELNPEFGEGGIAALPIFNDLLDRHIIDIVMQGNNIIAGAVTTDLDQNETRYFAMTRFTSEGKIDTSFGEDGKVIGLFNDSSHSGCEAIDTSDEDSGGIWLLGWFKRTKTDLEQVGLLRFDRNARESTPHALEQPSNTRLTISGSTLSIQDNSIMAAVNFSEIDGSKTQARVYRLDLQGNPGFGEKQFIDISHDQGQISISGLAQQAQTFLICGTLSKVDGKDYGFIARYLMNGTLDLTFANGAGFYIFLADSEDTRINQLILRPEGQLIVTGQAQRLDLPRIDALILQLTKDGSIDPAFNQGQPVFMSFKSGSSTFCSGALHDDAQLTVVGYSAETELYGVRYKSNGAQDTSFSLKEPLVVTGALVTMARSSDTLIALNSIGVSGPTGMVASFLNK